MPHVPTFRVDLGAFIVEARMELPPVKVEQVAVIAAVSAAVYVALRLLERSLQRTTPRP